MLVLARRVGEVLVIGDAITVTLLGITGTQVRLGIEAPKDVPVHREEIYQRIRNKPASDTSSSRRHSPQILGSRVNRSSE